MRPYQQWRQSSSVVNYTLKRTTDATIEPITLEEVKSWLGIADNETLHDDRIYGLITAARHKVELDTRRAFISQTWTLKVDEFPSHDEFIELPIPPLLNVTTGAITYTNTTGGTSTFAGSNWELDKNATPGILYLSYDKDWPTDVRTVQNAISIPFTAGYGTTATSTRTDVPEEAKIPMKMLITDWFDCPGMSGPANQDAYMSLIETLRWGDYR